MSNSDVRRFALGCCAAVVVLAGCGGGTSLSPSPAGPSIALRVPSAERARSKVRYKVLYSFGGSGDGCKPVCGPYQRQGHALRHDLRRGRKRRRNRLLDHAVRHGNRALQLQRRPGDGEYPFAGLINVKGTLYGTTSQGGAYCSSTAVAERSSRSRRPARKPCSTASAARETATTRLRASSTSRARSTARPMKGAQTATEPSSRSRRPARKPCSTASKAAGRRRIPAGRPHQRQGHALRHDRVWGRKRRRNGLLDHAVRHGNRAP